MYYVAKVLKSFSPCIIEFHRSIGKKVKRSIGVISDHVIIAS